MEWGWMQGEGVRLTFTLSMMPRRRHSTSGPHRSQSLAVHSVSAGVGCQRHEEHAPQDLAPAARAPRVQHLHELGVYRDEIARLE